MVVDGLWRYISLLWIYGRSWGGYHRGGWVGWAEGEF